MQRQLFTSATEDHYTPADIAERARAVMGGIEIDPASSYAANQTMKATRYYADPFTHDENTLNDRHFTQTALEVAQVTHVRDIESTGCVGFDGLRASWAARSLWLNPPFSVDAIDPASGAPILNVQGKPKRTRVIDQWVSRWVDATIPTRSNLNGVTTFDPPSVIHAMLLVPARTDTAWFTPLWHSRYALAFITGRLHFNEATHGATFPSVLVYYGSNIELFYMLFSEIGVCGRLLR